jgi:transcription antitermination factor NusG
MNESPWHVLHVVSNHEKRVTQHLMARSVEYYLPLYRERVKWSDRTVINERPLFASYVFAHILPQNRIHVLSVPGVLRILGSGKEDMVSAEEVDKIRAGLQRGLQLRPHDQFAIGTRVRVRSGVFAGTEGIVTNLQQQCRVVISVAAIRQYFSLQVDSSDLEILEKPVSRAGVRPRFAYGD